MNKHNVLIEISLSDLDNGVAESVIALFDRWGRGGAVVEQFAGPAASSVVKTYLLAEDDGSLRQIEVGLALLEQIWNVPLAKPHMHFLAERDWAEAWKANYDVLRIGRQVVIKPTWRDYTPRPGDFVITLDPGMAFGSGLHSTTRLCLEALEDLLQPGASVLDVGTGSGVLAVAAARLGAARVLALDTDTLAVRIARENVALNQVESLVAVEVGTVQVSNLESANGQMGKLANGQISKSASQQIGKSTGAETQTSDGRSPVWDVVVANILAETIVELAPGLVAALAPEGSLIASGIIADRADLVVNSLRQHGLSLVERRDEGEWVALIARHGATSLE